MAEIAQKMPSILDPVTDFIRRWIAANRERDVLAGLSGEQVGEIARDIGLAEAELRSLAGRGSGGADLLYERMAMLGLDAEEIRRRGNGILRDLERGCSCCEQKDICAHDMEMRPDDDGWKRYCVNVETLTELGGTGARHN